MKKAVLYLTSNRGYLNMFHCWQCLYGPAGRQLEFAVVGPTYLYRSNRSGCGSKMGDYRRSAQRSKSGLVVTRGLVAVDLGVYWNSVPEYAVTGESCSLGTSEGATRGYMS